MSKKPDRSLLDELGELFSLADPEPIKDLRTWFVGKSFRCFLCNRELDIRLSKKNRPYLICDSCQIQIFVRGSKGIERLVRLIQKQETRKWEAL